MDQLRQLSNPFQVVSVIPTSELLVMETDDHLKYQGLRGVDSEIAEEINTEATLLPPRIWSHHLDLIEALVTAPVSLKWRREFQQSSLERQRVLLPCANSTCLTDLCFRFIQCACLLLHT